MTQTKGCKASFRNPGDSSNVMFSCRLPFSQGKPQHRISQGLKQKQTEASRTPALSRVSRKLESTEWRLAPLWLFLFGKLGNDQWQIVMDISALKSELMTAFLPVSISSTMSFSGHDYESCSH